MLKLIKRIIIITLISLSMGLVFFMIIIGNDKPERKPIYIPMPDFKDSTMVEMYAMGMPTNPGNGNGNSGGGNPGFGKDNNPGKAKGKGKTKTTTKKKSSGHKIYRPKVSGEAVISAYRSEKLDIEFYNIIKNSQSITEDEVGFRVIYKFGEDKSKKIARKNKELESEVGILKFKLEQLQREREKENLEFINDCCEIIETENGFTVIQKGARND